MQNLKFIIHYTLNVSLVLHSHHDIMT